MKTEPRSKENDSQCAIKYLDGSRCKETITPSSHLCSEHESVLNLTKREIQNREHPLLGNIDLESVLPPIASLPPEMGFQTGIEQTLGSQIVSEAAKAAALDLQTRIEQTLGSQIVSEAAKAAALDHQTRIEQTLGSQIVSEAAKAAALDHDKRSLTDCFDDHFNLMSNPQKPAEKAQIETAETAWQMLQAIKIGLRESARTRLMTKALIVLSSLTLAISISALIVAILLR